MQERGLQADFCSHSFIHPHLHHANGNVRVRSAHNQRVGEPGLSPHLLKQAPSAGLPSQSGKSKGMLGSQELVGTAVLEVPASGNLEGAVERELWVLSGQLEVTGH